MQSVVLDHDGGIDDIVALIILLSRRDEVRLVGCLVTDADCFVADAVSVCQKVRNLACSADEDVRAPLFPIAASRKQAVHDFPREWRFDAKKMDALPSINIPLHGAAKSFSDTDDLNSPGEDQLATWVMKSESPVTICVTGPLSNVAHCLSKYGEAFARNVAEVVIMGGAVRTAGNVLPSFGTDNSAEWNIYWDAPSARQVLQSPLVRKVLFGLDATNFVPVSSEFVKQFGCQNQYLLSQFVGSSWAMCTHFSDLFGLENGYFAWDALTATYVLDPSLVLTSEDIVLDVVEEKGALSEGRTFEVVGDSQTTDGSAHPPLLPTKVVLTVDPNKFYDLVLRCCRLF